MVSWFGVIRTIEFLVSNKKRVSKMSSNSNENSPLGAANAKMATDAFILMIQGEGGPSNGSNNTNDPSTIATSSNFGANTSQVPATLTPGPNLTVAEIDNLQSKVQTSNLSGQASPKVSANRTPSLNNPPNNTTETPTQQPPVIRSEFSNPKSRFQEPPIPAGSIDEMTSTSVQDPGQGEDEGTKQSEETPPTLTEDSHRKVNFLVFIEWVGLVCITVALVSSLTIDKLENLKIWELELWKWFVLLLVIVCGRMFTEWFMNCVVFLFERKFLLKSKLLYFVYGLRKSVQAFIWFGSALLTWALLFDGKLKLSNDKSDNNKILNYVTRVLVSLLVGAVIWMVKTLLMKILAASFHVNTFFHRVKESLYHQYVLKKLSEPPAKTPGKLSVRRMRKWKERGQGEDQIYVDRPHELKKDIVSPKSMEYLCNMISTTKLSTSSKTIDEEANNEKGEQTDAKPKTATARIFKTVTNYFGHLISTVKPPTISKTIDEQLKFEKVEQKSEVEITCESDAKAAAARIFKNVARTPDSENITKADLLRFFRKEEIDNVLLQFEGAVEAGMINASMLNNWVVKVYLERKSLGHSLNDTQTAVHQLDRIVSVLVFVVIFIVWLLIIGIATTQLLLAVSSQMLLIVFVFGNTAKMVFEGIIFVFVMHPFDVGDRCVIDGVQMIVEEMNILSTNFLRYDNQKIFYPNAVLATRFIGNMFRSPFMGDAVEFAVSISTTVESIGALKDRIKEYIESKPEHWNPNHSVVVLEIENVNRMKMALYVTHTMNHQDMGEKTNRRSELVIQIKKFFEELSIEYNLLPQNVLVTYAGSATTAPVTIK